MMFGNVASCTTVLPCALLLFCLALLVLASKCIWFFPVLSDPSIFFVVPFSRSAVYYSVLRTRNIAMASTIYCQECSCGRSFDDTGAFTRHKKTCSKGKKRLAHVLKHAKESYHRKRSRIRGGEEFLSQTASSERASQTVSDETVCHFSSIFRVASWLTGSCNDGPPLRPKFQMKFTLSRFVVYTTFFKSD